MRKSIVLALALVLAVAGASFAATPEFGGTLELKADSKKSFTGPFGVTAKATLDVSFAEEGEVWSFDGSLKGSDLLAEDGATWMLEKYKGVINADGFGVTLASNYKIGKVATPFDFVVMADEVEKHRIRFNTDIGGLTTHAELEEGESNVKLRTETDLDGFTVGAGAVIDLDENKDTLNTLVGYGKTTIDIVTLTGAAGVKEDETIYGVSASVKVIEQLTVDGKYTHSPADAWDVSATFTEGVLQAKAKYDHKEVATVSAEYRGSEDNQAFGGDQFHKDKYYNNVAPGARVTYTTDKNKVTVEATAPLADNFHVKGKVVVEEDEETDIAVDARYAVNDKVTVLPYYKSEKTVFGSELKYAVGDGAEIGLDGKVEDGNKQSLLATFTIKF